jgi:2-haloacid dehalogenase
VGATMSADAVVFDLFGTLLDITSLRTLVETLLGKKNAEALVQRWRDKQIAYAFAATLMDRYDDFDVLTARALDYALAALEIEADAQTRTKLCDGWLELRPYPDATLTLEALRSRGMRVAVLTNGTLATAKRALANTGLDSLVNDVWSVDEVRKYKPAPQVYAMACMHAGKQPSQIGFVSSNGWDATGASAFGFQVAWCNRSGLPSETMPPAPTHIVTSLQEVVALFCD